MSLAALLLLTAVSGPVPPALRAELEQPLKGLARQLSQEKTRRLAYSRFFEPLDGGRWETVAYRDSLEGERMRTERLRLTLAPGERNGWYVESEQVEDVYEGLHRTLPGGERYSRFDGFVFEAEGIRLAAEGGCLATSTFAGEVATLTIVADSMTFEYDPPPELTETARVARALAADKPERRTFVPERFTLNCSPGVCANLLGTAFRGLREARESEMHKDLRRAMDERREQLTDLQEEHAFRGFRLQPRPENRFWTAWVKRKTALDYSTWLAFDDDEGVEVTYGTSHEGALYAYHDEATRRRVRDLAALERQDDAAARDFEVRSIRGTVELALETPDTLSGDLVYVLRTKRAVRVLPFFVARLSHRGGDHRENREPGLTIDALEDGEGRDLTFARTGPAGGFVVLPQEVPAGTDVTLRLAFENRGAIFKLTHSYSRVSRAAWLPFVRRTDRIERFDLTVRVPEQYTTLGVGRLAEEWKEEGTAVTRWTAESPVCFPSVIFGKYVTAKPTQKAHRADGTEIPVTIHVDEVGLEDWGVRPRQLPAIADQAVRALNLYRDVFGVDYPYAKLDLVNDPMGFRYGQSPASIVYLGTGTFRGGGGRGLFQRSLVAHEVGHQWWGGLITNANDRNYWWVESLAEYASALYDEAVAERGMRERGIRAYLAHVNGWRSEALRAGLFGSVQNGPIVNVGGYRAALYAKGPFMFHMLRITFGEEPFFRFLKALAQEMKDKEIVTRDIQRVAEREIGGSLEGFFDQWVRGAGIPELTFDWRTRKNPDGSWNVEGTIRQRVVLGRERIPMDGVLYEGVVAVTSVSARWKEETTKRMLLDGAETRFQFRVDEEPGDVLLNAHGEMLNYAGPVTWATADGRKGRK